MRSGWGTNACSRGYEAAGGASGPVMRTTGAFNWLIAAQVATVALAWAAWRFGFGMKVFDVFVGLQLLAALVSQAGWHWRLPASAAASSPASAPASAARRRPASR